LQLDGLFETLIGGRVTTAGNHRCSSHRGRCPGFMAASSSVTSADQVGRHRGAEEERGN